MIYIKIENPESSSTSTDIKVSVTYGSLGNIYTGQISYNNSGDVPIIYQGYGMMGFKSTTSVNPVVNLRTFAVNEYILKVNF